MLAFDAKSENVILWSLWDYSSGSGIVTETIFRCQAADLLLSILSVHAHKKIVPLGSAATKTLND